MSKQWPWAGDQIKPTDAQHVRIPRLMPTLCGKFAVPQHRMMDALVFIAKQGCVYRGRSPESDS